MTSLDILLENYWILREQDAEKYESVRSNLTKDEYEFIKNKLGYKLIENPYLIKLEKVPGIPKAWMGITEFQSKLEYVFLCIILLFLENKSPKEQFILSGLIEFIENSSLDINLGDVTIDFTVFKQRQAMVRVLKFIRNLGFIKLYDGDENKFAENVTSDALYEITGVSKFFLRNFTSNIVDCKLYTDIYEQEQLGLEQDKGIERRRRIYRRIFLENAIYPDGSDDQDFAYIRNYKNTISKDCDELFESSFEVHKDVAYMVLSEEKSYKNIFPGNKAISDIVLFVNKKLRIMLDDKTLEITVEDRAEFSIVEWERFLLNVREEYGNGFSKEYKTLEDENFVDTVTKFMEEFEFIRKDEENKIVEVMPIAWKMIGSYPKDFEENEE